jgi:excisionase family DNA binding protein
MTTPSLLTTRQAALRMGVTHGRVRQLVTAGRLKSVKIGRSRYVQEAEVEAFERRPAGRPLGSVLYKIDVLGRRRRIRLTRRQATEARAS